MKPRRFYLLSLGEAVSKGRIVPHGQCICSVDIAISDHDAAQLDDVLGCVSVSLSPTKEFPADDPTEGAQ